MLILQVTLLGYEPLTYKIHVMKSQNLEASKSLLNEVADTLFLRGRKNISKLEKQTAESVNNREPKGLKCI